MRPEWQDYDHRQASTMTFSITREHAAQLYEIYERALHALGEAEPIIFNALEGEDRKAYIEAHSRVVVDILAELRAPLAIQYRDLDTYAHQGPPDTLLDADQQEAADRLTAAQIQRIDDALLSDCARSARKVARIVGSAWMQLRDELPDVPAGFYAQRVKVMVEADKLESRGNLDHMGFSEVRLPRDPLDEVVDGPVMLNAGVLESLKAFRDGRKRTDLIEAEPDDPSLDLSPNLDRLAERLLCGIEANPSKRWVMAQFQQSLVPVIHIDDEGRKRFSEELKNVMQIIGIESDDGLLDFYLEWL
jgi:hypothetical protein